MNPLLVQAALAVSGSPLLLLLAKATIIALASLLLVRVAARTRASVRHVTLATAFAVLAALPLTTIPVPTPVLEIPVTFSPATMDDAAIAALESLESPSRPMAIAGAATRPALNWQRVALLVWVIGAIGCLAPVLAGLYQLHRYRRFGVPLLAAATVLDEVAERLGVRRRLTLLRHESIAGPMTYGLRRPVVMLPADAGNWEEPALRRALIHELEHIRRCDWLVHCGSRIICAAYWFHPLVWIMRRRLALEAERACDDAVLAQADPAQYADQLVDLAERLSLGERRPMVAMAGRDDLTTRIQAVLDPLQRRGRAGLKGVSLAVSLVLLAFTVSSLRAVALPSPSTAAAGPARSAVSSIDLSTPLSFEVASIKRNLTGEPARGRRSIDRFTATATPTLQLLRLAFDVTDSRLVDVPEWVRGEAYDVEAIAPAGAQVGRELPPMLRALLRDRFNLRVHVETRELPIYELVVSRQDGRLGPNLAPAACDCRGDRQEPGCRQGPPVTGAPELNGLTCAQLGVGGRSIFRGYPMDTFARYLSSGRDRVVVDRTGLTGTWNAEIHAAPENTVAPGQPAPLGDVPTFVTALQEQLGLRLRPARGEVEVLVIDNIDRPSPNDTSEPEVSPPSQVTPPSESRSAFAVASVKINRMGPRAGGAAPMGGTGAPPSVGGRFVRTNIPIDVLIAQAYGPLQRFEIAGVPEWAGETRVDVEARAEGNPTPAEMNRMVQALLAERFGLVVRRETREQPVYALVIARAGELGPRLKAHADNSGCMDPQTSPNNVRALDPTAPLPPPPCGAFRGAPGIGRLAAADVPLDLLGRAVSGQLGRMVVDRTGLTGNYDFLLEWTPLQQVPGVDPVAINNPDRPSIFTAFEEQLGLRLEAQTGPVTVLIVERVEMPTEN